MSSHGQPPQSPSPGDHYQGPAPYGQPARAAQAPYPAQSPQHPPAYGSWPRTPSPPPSRRKWPLPVILGSAAGIGVLAVGGFVALLLFVRQGGAGDAEHDGLEIGECLTESAEVVSCGSGEARFRVLGNAGWWSQTDYDNEPAIGELCEAYPTYETSFWIGDASGDSGEVVCVESVTP